MRKRFVCVSCALLIFSVSIISWRSEVVKKTNKIAAEPVKSSAKELFSQYIEEIYHTAQLHNAGLDLAVFQKAITGYFNLKASNKIPQYSSIITVVDLAKSSCTKRMWIVDLINKELLLNTWVAHGNGSGDDVAN
ncbi:MAG: murein L,D-transpeptidase catalytic domain-containing protein, partial [Mucilaginibacter sp.]